MKKIRIDEKVSVWQTLEVSFPDDVDLSTPEKVKQALNGTDWFDMSVKNTYLETEEHLDYDYSTIEVIQEG